MDHRKRLAHVTVHPRMRGERDYTARPEEVRHGSSPHARGTQVVAAPDFRDRRFIPACAGNALLTPMYCAVAPVHPRIRGERSITSMAKAKSCGSSPHTRGTPGRRVRSDGPQRFIPAYAGNAHRLPPVVCSAKVHPRIRGERAGRAHRARRASGSSPHTRGTHGYWFLHDAQTRFIPAYAGNASWRSCHPRRWPVHPRIRGERVLTVSTSGALAGSSPHTRGTPAPPGQGPARRRFIPAYAGNATSCEHTSTRPTVHPRIRGERPDHR